MERENKAEAISTSVPSHVSPQLETTSAWFSYHKNGSIILEHHKKLITKVSNEIYDVSS